MVKKNSAPPPCFVFAVCGAAHVSGLTVALEFLRRATRMDILVVQREGDPPAQHDQCIAVGVPAHLTDHQAAIWLKTSLHRVIGAERTFCYLDSDVIVLSAEIESIFDASKDAVVFAKDHVSLDEFSRSAVNCGCVGPCPHLREALFCDFGIDVESNSRLWNGGVFVATLAAWPMLEDWHSLALSIFARPYWKIRDQGVLAGAMWRAGLSRADILPSRFNTIIDCFTGVPLARRKIMSPARLATMAEHLPLPNAVAAHFINQGIGRAGWPHWDHLARLLGATA